jgi:hypothetical protein
MPDSVDTSNEPTKSDLHGTLRGIRERGRYWLLCASVPILWGLASQAVPASHPPQDAELSVAPDPATSEPAPEDATSASSTAAAEAVHRTRSGAPPKTAAASSRVATPSATSSIATLSAIAMPSASSIIATHAVTHAAAATAAAATTPAAATPAAEEAEATPRECVHTPLTPEELARALHGGHVRRFGAAPSPDRWACAWAHVAHEQARGQAVYSNNLGHVTARSGAGRVCRRRLRERVSRAPDRWQVVDVWFPIFDAPVDGAAAYWQLLSTSYASFLARCDEGDPRRAARRLADIGYFTGPEDPYIDGLGRLFVNARSSLIPRLMAADAAR